MKFLQIVAFAVLGVSTSVLNAATVFTANNADVDFIVPADFTLTVAVFANESDLSSGTNPLDVDFTNAIPSVFGSPALISGELAVGTGNSFVVGVSADNGISWVADNGFNGGSTGVLSFEVNQLDLAVLLVDVQVVPVPAAAWLFGSGLLGLVFVARRKAQA